MVTQVASIIAIESRPIVQCLVCSSPTDATATGLCHSCADRLPRMGDCLLTVALVVALVATESYGGDDSAVYRHLSGCPTCRSVLDGISATATVARMEQDFANGDDYAADHAWQGVR